MTRAPWKDLLGVPYVERGRDPAIGLDCLGLVMEFYRRAGVAFPDLDTPPKDAGRPSALEGGVQALGWEALPPGRAQDGDLAVYADHVGVIVDGGVLHVWRSGQVGVSPQAGVRFVARPPHCEDITCTLVRNPLAAPHEREVRRIPWRPGLTVRDVIPIPWKREGLTPRIMATAEGRRLELDEPVQGQMVLAVLPAGDFGVSLLVGFILSALSFVVNLLLAPSAPKGRGEREAGSPTFDLTGVRNTALTGIPIPVVYGEHVVGGNVISIFFTVDEIGRQVLNMLIALCHGPIESVGGITADVDDLSGAQIPDSIKLNGTPAHEYVGTRISIRLGGEEQLPVPGFNDVTVDVPYDKTLVVGDPFTHTSDDIEAFEGVINFPLGLFDAQQNGSLNPRSVFFTLRYRVSGSTGAYTTQALVFTATRRAPFSRSFRVDGLVKAKYEIQIERTSPIWPETQTDRESKSVLVAVNEITYDSLAYPGIALLGLRAVSTDQLAGTPPTVTSIVRGRKVWNWDTISTTNPQFNEVWTRSPPLVAMDMLLHPIYGLARGGLLTLDNIDLAAFNSWRLHAATLVDDGRGGTVPRAEVDMVWDTAEDGWDAVQSIAQSAWANLLLIGRKITVVLEQTSSPKALFGMGNASEFALKYTDRSLRPNIVQAQFPNRETDYSSDVAQRPTDAIFQGQAPVVENLALVGVVRAAQAYRMAQFRLNWAEKRGKTGTLKCGIEAIHVLPGDVVRLAHDATKWGASGRTNSAPSTTTITLDRDVTLATGDKIVVRTDRTGVDVFQERTTTTTGLVAAGDPITVSAAWDASDSPARGDPYSIGAPASFTREYQITEVRTNPDLSRELTVLEYDATVYSDDPGPIEEFTEDFPDPQSIPPPVISVRAEEVAIRQADGTLSTSLDVHIERDERAKEVDVYWRPHVDGAEGADDWRYAGRTAGDRLLLNGVGGEGDIIQVAAVPVSARGARADPRGAPTKTVRVGGLTGRPDDPAAAGSRVYQVDSDVVLTLPAPSSADVKEYEIRAGSKWGGSHLVTRMPAGETTFKTRIDQAYKLQVRARTRQGIYSPLGITILLDGFLPADKTTIDSQDEQAGWVGTKVNTQVTGGQLQLSGANLTGTYVTPMLTSATLERHLILVYVDGRLADTAMTWDEAAFSWDDPAYFGMTWDTAFLTGFELQSPASYTWDAAGFTWDSPMASMLTWDGPTDIVGGLSPKIEVRISTDGGGSFGAYEEYSPREVVCNAVEVRLTLNRPSTVYDPRALSLRTVLASASTFVQLRPDSSLDNVVQPTTAAVVPLTIKAQTSQSADLLRFQNSAGGNLIRFSSLGQFINGTEDINASSKKILNVLNPTLAQDAATKDYVDTQITSETGKIVSEQTFAWHRDQEPGALWNSHLSAPVLLVDSTTNILYRELAATGITDIGFRTFKIPVWYIEAAVGRRFSIRLGWYIPANSPGSSQAFAVEIIWQSFKRAVDAFGSPASSTHAVTVSSGLTVNQSQETTINVTSGSAVPAGDTHLVAYVRRLGDDAADTYGFEIRLHTLEILSGVDIP